MNSALFALALLSFGSLEESRTVARHFSSELELKSERFELTGSEGENSEVQHPPEQVREQADEFELVDTFDPDDPAARFERLYKTVMNSVKVGDQRRPHEKTQSAGIEGKTVTFERERDGSYTRTCTDPNVRAGLLKRLRAELSFAALLPPAGTSAAESWEIPAAEFARLFSPVESDVHRPRAKLDAPKGGLNLAPAAMGVPLAALLNAPEGTFVARPRAVEEDGTGDEFPRQAELEFKLTSTFDGSDLLLGGLEAKAEDALELTYRPGHARLGSGARERRDPLPGLGAPLRDLLGRDRGQRQDRARRGRARALRFAHARGQRRPGRMTHSPSLARGVR